MSTDKIYPFYRTFHKMYPAVIGTTSVELKIISSLTCFVLFLMLYKPLSNKSVEFSQLYDSINCYILLSSPGKMS